MSEFTPKRIGSVLQAAIDEMGARRKINEARVIEAWAHMVGTSLNRVTDSAWVKGDELHLKIRSSTWRQEIHLQRSKWLSRLHEELGEELVTEIVLH